MRSIAIVSQKGGSGKSTLSVHLAVAALRTGQRVEITDTDLQGSSAAWGDSREADEPAVVAIAAGNLTSALAEARSEGFDVVVIDTQPRAASLANIVQAADFALIPIRASAFDVATAEQTQPHRNRGRQTVRIRLERVPERGHRRSPNRGRSLRSSASSFDVTIGERRIYGPALQTGLAVQTV